MTRLIFSFKQLVYRTIDATLTEKMEVIHEESEDTEFIAGNYAAFN